VVGFDNSDERLWLATWMIRVAAGFGTWFGDLIEWLDSATR
jgi:hypothetical protein